MKKRFATFLMTAALAFLLVPALHAPVFAEEENPVPTEPQNGIPLVIINVDESEEAIAAAEEDSFDEETGERDVYGTIEDMNSSEDHSVRCVGTIEIKVPEGYEGEYGSVKVPEGPVDLKYIRGRGNSTWDTDPNTKKPYKIKLKDGENLFGMGKNKEWALMANAYDKTLLRNRIFSWLGERLGFAYTPQMIPVDVVMIGSSGYSRELGSYCLSELVSRGNNRLDEDVKLLAIYTEFQDGDTPHFTTNQGIDIMFDDPEEVSEDVESAVNELEELIMEPETIDAERHDAIAARMDLISAADYWWLQEFACNNDAFVTSSTYMYFVPDEGKIYWGPLWDFDLAAVYNEDSEEFGADKGFNNTEMLWLDELRDRDPLFADILQARWDVLNPQLTELTREGGKLDEWNVQMKSSWDRNKEIWEGQYEDFDYGATELDQNIELFRAWIKGRQEWINDNIDSVGNVFCTATFRADGIVVAEQRERIGSIVSEPAAPPDKEGYLFSRWVNSETGEDYDSCGITGDTIFDAVYVSVDEAVKPEAVCFVAIEDWVELQKETYYGNWMNIYPDDALVPSRTWSSSDESVATVNDVGEVTLHSEGDVTITLTMYNGVSGSYVLHVYDSLKTEPTKPTGISARQQNMNLKVGKIKQIEYSILPEGGIFKDCSTRFECDDSDCIELDEMTGAVRGLKPGEATVTISLLADDDAEFSTTCKITVYCDEETAQALIDKAEADLEAAQAAFAAADPSDPEAMQQLLTDLFNAQKALTDAERIMQKVKDDQAKEQIAELEKELQDLTDQVAELSVVDISNYAVTMGTSFPYTGKEIRPAVKVSGVNESCYTVSYANNRKVGTGTVTIKAKGDKYKGTIKKTFKITKGKNTLKVKGKTAKVKYKKAKKKKQTLKASKVIKVTNPGKGKLSYAKVSGNKKITVNKKTGKVTVKKGIKKGTYKVKVKVTAAGNSNYKKASKTVTFKVQVK